MKACAAALSILALAACSEPTPAPIVDPIQAAINETPTDAIGLFAFRDKLIIRNNKRDALTACIVVVDQALTSEIGTLASGATETVMRSRFKPYVEADEFYRRALIRKDMTCQSPTGPVRVNFVAQPERSVFIPSRK